MTQQKLDFGDIPVSRFLSDRPSRALTFEALGIDYGSLAGATISDVCGQSGVSLQRLQAALAESAAVDAVVDPYFGGVHEADLEAMIDHILLHYHEPHRHLFSCLSTLLRADPSRDFDSRFEQLRNLIEALADALRVHMMKEEQVLFPTMRRWLTGNPMTGGCAASMNPEAPLKVMEMDHQQAGQELQDISALVGELGSQLDPILLGSIDDLRIQVIRHMFLENNVLFPAFREFIA